jgi:hypothetical protein
VKGRESSALGRGPAKLGADFEPGTSQQLRAEHSEAAYRGRSRPVVRFATGSV